MSQKTDPLEQARFTVDWFLYGWTYAQVYSAERRFSLGLETHPTSFGVLVTVGDRYGDRAYPCLT